MAGLVGADFRSEGAGLEGPFVVAPVTWPKRGLVVFEREFWQALGLGPNLSVVALLGPASFWIHESSVFFSI